LFYPLFDRLSGENFAVSTRQRGFTKTMNLLKNKAAVYNGRFALQYILFKPVGPIN